jgi:hypothetical protein
MGRATRHLNPEDQLVPYFYDPARDLEREHG